MSSKVWLTVFSVVSAVVIGGAGYFAYSSYQEYSEAISSWDAKVGTIESLERRAPYPNEENQKALEAVVQTYRESVDALFGSLNTFQRELDTELPNTGFQLQVRDRVEAFRRYAAQNGLLIEDGTDFQLGFDVYATTLPPPPMVPILDYKLDAIDHLLRTLVDSEVEELRSFVRDPIPGETGVTGQQEGGVVHRYPVRLRFRATHEAFQEFINSIANDREFFYIVRVLKVRNSMTAGPVKLTSDDGTLDLPRYTNPETGEYASYEMLVEWGYDDTEESLRAVDQNAREAGFLSSRQDARILMGQERLNVFMLVDITRFVEEGAAAAVEEEPGRPAKGRRAR